MEVIGSLGNRNEKYSVMEEISRERGIVSLEME